MMDDEYDADETKLYEELYSLMGAKIRVNCDGVVQEGIISTIRPDTKRVMLDRVYFILPDKKPIFSGKLRYRFSDLTNYEVVATAKELNPYPKFEYLENLLKNKNVGKQYSINDLFFGGLLSEESDDEEEVEEEKESESMLEVPTHLQKKVPQDNVILDSINLEWKQAMRHIEQQKTIGVSFSGYKVSRLGKLSWVCVCTSSCVFLIDIEKLGVSAFDNGLRSIFEDTFIRKVIHDCRFASDCLYNLFDTKLINVFDTLVADFVVSMQYYNDKYKYQFVQSLNSCLRIHLDILPEFTYAHDRCLNKNDENTRFSKRPVNDALRYVLIKDTVYLLILHEALSKKLLGPLQRNVQRYLRIISGSSQQALDLVGDEISSPDCIPPDLLMHGIQTVQFRKPEKKVPVTLECKFIHPVTGKVIGGSKNLCDTKSADLKNKEIMPCSNKENFNCGLGRVRQQKLPVLRKEIDFKTEINQFEKRSVIVDQITMRPSGRHVDEVYHKLVNNLHFRSQNSESIVNVKPSERYVSKFTMKMPLECSAFSDSSSQNLEKSENIDPAPNTCQSFSVVKTSDTSTSFPDYSDTWAKLRACKVPQSSCNSSKSIRYVPAGRPG